MSPTKKRQTMGKIMRERELSERRALKAEKKEAKKLAGSAEPVESDPDNPIEAPAV
jgi:hypothetical protein